MNDKTPPHLRGILDEHEPETEQENGLPSLRDNEFRVCGRPSHKPLFSVHFISANGSVQSFQYMHLDSRSSFSPTRLVLRFVGSKTTDVVVEGRNLWQLYDYLHQHRMPWVRVAARDFAQDGEIIVTGVRVTCPEDVNC